MHNSTAIQGTEQGTPTAAIMELVEQRDWVSFVEIVNRLKSLGHQTGGDHTIYMDLPNVVLWDGLSAELVAAVQQLLSERRLFVHIAQPLIYFIDGVFPSLPLAKRVPVNGYKKPHWLPVTFRTVPPPRRIQNVA